MSATEGYAELQAANDGLSEMKGHLDRAHADFEQAAMQVTGVYTVLSVGLLEMFGDAVQGLTDGAESYNAVAPVLMEVDGHLAESGIFNNADTSPSAQLAEEKFRSIGRRIEEFASIINTHSETNRFDETQLTALSSSERAAQAATAINGHEFMPTVPRVIDFLGMVQYLISQYITEEKA